jgi:predicted RNA-binding protein with PIN domain
LSRDRQGAPVVLIDAENVRRSLWPNIERMELVELSRLWAHGQDVRALVVFDGEAPAEETGASFGVAGSGSESADDRIVREAERLRASGETFWLVTSDRALRAAAAAGAARVLGGGSFARELQTLRRS